MGDRCPDRIDRGDSVEVFCLRIFKTQLGKEIKNVKILLRNVVFFITETGSRKPEGCLHQFVIIDIVRLQQPFIGKIDRDGLLFFTDPAVMKGDRTEFFFSRNRKNRYRQQNREHSKDKQKSSPLKILTSEI